MPAGPSMPVTPTMCPRRRIIPARSSSSIPSRCCARDGSGKSSPAVRRKRACVRMSCFSAARALSHALPPCHFRSPRREDGTGKGDGSRAHRHVPARRGDPPRGAGWSSVPTGRAAASLRYLRRAAWRIRSRGPPGTRSPRRRDCRRSGYRWELRWCQTPRGRTTPAGG